MELECDYPDCNDKARLEVYRLHAPATRYHYCNDHAYEVTLEGSWAMGSIEPFWRGTRDR